MMRLLAGIILMCVVPLGLHAQTQPPSDQSKESQEVRAVVERFYKLETAGTWLEQSRWHELENFFTDVGPASVQTSISVLKGYQVGEAKKIVDADGSVHYGVDVDCLEWGSINSFLRFAKARATGEAAERRAGEYLSLTNGSVTAEPTEKQEKRKGALGWRMRDFGPVDSVDVDTAVSWVTRLSDKSNDQMIKYNAKKTIAILRNLSAGTLMPGQAVGAASESALRVAQRFVQLESHSTPKQWNQLANFFVETPRPQWNKVYVVDVLHVDADLDGRTRSDSSEIAISVRPLGELDSSLRLSTYSRLPSNNSACCGSNYLGFTLVLSDKHWQVAPDGTVKQLEVPITWRVEDTSFNPIITLDTAIRYVVEERAKNGDPMVKKNGATTLGILKNRRQDRPAGP